MTSRTFTTDATQARIYDTHTLFLKCDGVTVANVTALFRSVLESLDASIDRRFHVNVVADMSGASLGMAFVYVADVAIYYMLLGRNPDGSNRVAPVVVPEPEPTTFSSWSSIAPALTDTIEPGASWGDICTQEVAHPPSCRVYLPPLLSLPPLMVNGEARRVRVFPAVVYPVNPKYAPHILKSNNVPPWLTVADLRAFFTPFVSDPSTYPTVTINADRTAFVTFDSTTNEAQFTLHMTKKVMVTEPSGDTTVLMFNHSFCGYPGSSSDRPWRSERFESVRSDVPKAESKPRTHKTRRTPSTKSVGTPTSNRFELLRS